MSETIAAIATPPGRGAVAIVRLSGSSAAQIAQRVFASPHPLRERVATLGRVVAANGATIDQALALFFPRPHSLTGEDVLELHVHGSPVVARDTLAAVLAAGARLAGPGEFTRRAFLAGKLDLSAAEAVADLIAAEHHSAARAAAARLGGGLGAAVKAQRDALERILEELAAALDFPDEVPSPNAVELSRRLRVVHDGLVALEKTWERGRLVREGVGVAIVGAPNAGKSSLLNALLGEERALVSEIAGTTRDTLEETLSLGDVVARIVDTAGIRHIAASGAQAGIEAAGIARAQAALAHARVALVVVDASVPVSTDASAILEATRGRERVVFYNKSDLGRVAFDSRTSAEHDATLGSVFCYDDVVAVKERLRAVAVGDDTIDLERPMLASARHADAVLEARRALERALETLASGDPVDLVAGDVMEAVRSLGLLTGRDATEALLDAIFARFCIGK